MARLLITIGILLIVLGLAVHFLRIVPGRLPGDIRWQGKRGTFYFPVVTCIVISVVLSLISWFFRSR
ncbi:MAG: DUF2905 domain-containing protein [Terriglobia bacterium]